jgi:hypothetical protein
VAEGYGGARCEGGGFSHALGVAPAQTLAGMGLAE